LPDTPEQSFDFEFFLTLRPHGGVSQLVAEIRSTDDGTVLESYQIPPRSVPIVRGNDLEDWLRTVAPTFGFIHVSKKTALEVAHTLSLRPFELRRLLHPRIQEEDEVTEEISEEVLKPRLRVLG